MKEGLYIDYYNRPFLFFGKDISSKVRTNTNYLRNSFWNLIPDGIYETIDAQKLFISYSKSIEKKASEIVKKYSIEYWLHLSRRIGVNSGGENKHHITIITNRFYVLALIQKYGKTYRCGHIGNSKQIKISQVFNGLLLSDEFEYERKIIEEHPAQLVLTDFNSINLLEYYKLENLAYELWVCAAKLRAIGKGATISVDQNLEEYFYENPDTNLDKLISSYDERLSGNLVTETGTVFSSEKLDFNSEIFVPVLNVSGVSSDYLKPLFEKFLDIELLGGFPVNFIIAPFPIKKFITAHQPFEQDFINKYKVNYKSIVIALASLCYRYFHITIFEKKPALFHIASRGYNGPFTKAEIINEIKYFVPYICEILTEEAPSDNEIESSFQFLELSNQNDVDVYNLGTLNVFLKANEDYYLIDYSIIPTFLDNLFNQIDLNKHNFRGKLLEDSIGINSYLPNTPCKSISGTSKQIDFSYLKEGVLIIGECKVVSRKTSYFLGSIKSISLRAEKVVEKSLNEIDEKADWLISNQEGTNYNIKNIDYILPIAISPFVEYISSLNRKYWLNDTLPRVLSLEEFIELIKNFNIDTIKYNIKTVANRIARPASKR